MILKHIKLDNKGRILVRRLCDDYWMAVTAFNFNTCTLQVGGWKTDYPDLVGLIGEDAAKELVDYSVLRIYKFGECE